MPETDDALPPDVAAALKLAQEVLELIEDEVPEWKVLKNQEFFEGVEEKARGIAETVRRTGRVSAGQRAALENMKGAVEKWV